MAVDLVELKGVLTRMEAALNSITDMDSEILEFIDANYSDLLNDQKMVQVFKSVGDAEDELQRQLNFLRLRLTSGIPEFKEVCDAA